MVDPSFSSPDRGRDRLLALGIAVMTLGTVVVAHLVPGGHPPPPAASSAPLAPAADPRCKEWTDNCVVCVRGTDGANCSLPGIACVRKPQHCIRRG